MKIYKIYKKLILENIKLNNIVYHTSNPKHRNSIMKQGLIPKQESWGNAIDSDYNKELGDKGAIFIVNGGEYYDSTYDDDVWEINTNSLKNKWYKDNYVTGALYTLTPIDKNNIKLIYKGTGKSL